MEVNVRDFIEKWTGDYIVENDSSLTENILNKEIVNIRLERTMWTKKSGDIILTIKDK